MPELIELILRDSGGGGARLPSDAEVFACLRQLGVPEAQRTFALASEFKAPGVFEQYHFIAGNASCGVIKEEEEERGAGRGATYFLFSTDRGLEIYVAHYSGIGGELAVLARIGDASREISDGLFRAMGISRPASPGEAASAAAAERLRLHRERCATLRGHVKEWFRH